MGVIGWEMAGLRPPRLALVHRWFDDDSECLRVMTDFQSGHGNYATVGCAGQIFRYHLSLSGNRVRRSSTLVITRAEGTPGKAYGS